MKNARFTSAVLALTIALLFRITLVVPVVEAQDDLNARNPSLSLSALKGLSLEQLANIDVTTESKQPVKLAHSPAAIDVLTGDDIRRSGVTTIVDALRLVPGVEVAKIDGNEWAVGIRGFGTRLSRSVLVLIDGRTVYTPLFAGTYWEVQDALLPDIDRIEVIRGPGGTIWGPNAINGVINIITKSAKDTQGAIGIAEGGNQVQGLLGVRYGGSVSSNLTYRGYAKAFNRAPEYHPDGNNFDRWRSAQVGFRLDWTNGASDTVTVEGDAYNMRAGESLVANTYVPPFARILNQRARFSGGNILTRWTRLLRNGSDVQFQAFYDGTNHWEPNFAEVRHTLDFDFIHHLRGPSPAKRGLGSRHAAEPQRHLRSGIRTCLHTRRSHGPTRQRFRAG